MASSNRIVVVLAVVILVTFFASLLIQIVALEVASMEIESSNHVQSQQVPSLGRRSQGHFSFAAERTVTMYVVSLQGVAGADRENEGRLDAFQSRWNETCKGTRIKFKQCPGELDTRRGFGLTRAYVSCFQQAMNDTSHETEDIVTFLEDDARLFVPDFCNATTRNELWSSAPDDAFLIMLGGHTWQFRNDNVTLRDPKISYLSFQFLEPKFSFGSYAFAVPRANLQALQDGYKWDLEHPQLDFENHDKLSPDKSFYDHAKRNRQKVYATDPLVFFHEAGYSNTWKAKRGAVLGDTMLEEEEEEDEYEEEYSEEKGKEAAPNREKEE